MVPDSITDEELDAAIEAGERVAPFLIGALTARYLREEDVVVVTFVNHEAVNIPRTWLQGLQHATASELAFIEITSTGSAVEWPLLDTGFTAEGLAHGRYGCQSWMRQIDRRRNPDIKRIAEVA